MHLQSAVLAMIDSVCPSDRLSHVKTTPAKIMRLHWRIAPWFYFLTVNFERNPKGNMTGEGAE